MNKPKKLTKEQIATKAAKLKNQKITFYRVFPAGKLVGGLAKIDAWARSKDCDPLEVNKSAWGGGINVSRTETSAEKLKRVTLAEQDRYERNLSNYNYEQRKLERERLEAQRYAQKFKCPNCNRCCSCGRVF